MQDVIRSETWHLVICDYGCSLTLGFDVVLQLQLISLPIVSLARVFSLDCLLAFSFFQVPIYLNSFPFSSFAFMISKPQPLVGSSWGPSCVCCVCVCVCVCCVCVCVCVLCVCVCFSGTVLSQWAECEKRQTERERREED